MPTLNFFSQKCRKALSLQTRRDSITMYRRVWRVGRRNSEPPSIRRTVKWFRRIYLAELCIYLLALQANVSRHENGNSSLEIVECTKRSPRDSLASRSPSTPLASSDSHLAQPCYYLHTTSTLRNVRRRAVFLISRRDYAPSYIYSTLCLITPRRSFCFDL